MLQPGVYPAAVTPFDARGRIDMPGVAKLLAWFEAGGCKGAVLAGTNGEGPSLSAPEKRDLVRDAFPLRGSLELILGIATSSLDEAIWLTKQAGASGAAAVLVMPPSYFVEASEDAICSWFERVMDASPVPVLVYNLPQRTGVTLCAEQMHRLSKHPQMGGLKDSSGHEPNLASYSEALSGTGKSLFVGDETLLLKALRTGWTGTISGAANVMPQWLAQVVEEFAAGKAESAETKFELALPAIRALRKSPQPGTNKALLHRLGVLPLPDLRLPLAPPPDERVEDAARALRESLGLVTG